MSKLNFSKKYKIPQLSVAVVISTLWINLYHKILYILITAISTLTVSINSVKYNTINFVNIFLLLTCSNMMHNMGKGLFCHIWTVKVQISMGIFVWKWALTLVMLNKLRWHAHFQLSANQITWSRLLIQIHILNGKQCRSRSVGFFRCQLIWIYTVCKGRAYPGSAGQG